MHVDSGKTTIHVPVKHDTCTVLVLVIHARARYRTVTTLANDGLACFFIAATRTMNDDKMERMKLSFIVFT
jgi:hypothetical protein